MEKLLIFNWKMNPQTLQEALSLAKASDYENVVVAPPFPFIEKVARVLKKSRLGAQDVAWADKGAFTGEVSAQELKNLCVEYVIIGHSERRHKLGETNEIIAKKLKAAVDAGLIPILCVGETKKEKDAGRREIVIKRQLEKGLSLITKSSKLKAKNLLIAYEPVWAIGTGDPETPESALTTIKFIKSLVFSQMSNAPTKVGEPTRIGFKCQMLYGGSVNSQNLGDYIKYKEVDGALVGGASLKKEEVKKMARYQYTNAY